MYRNNQNYGGLLQAYALVKYLNQFEHVSAEQICTDFSSDTVKKVKRNESGVKSLARSTFERCITILWQRKFKIRAESLTKFEKSIPHSYKVYNHSTMPECEALYDLFIAGSDQVWNMDWYKPEYFLNFVSEKRKKYSYAASMPNVNLTEDQARIVKISLNNFASISVREDKTAVYLKNKLGIDSSVVLDPTMLLTLDKWEEVVEKIDLPKKKYTFCYFLGGSRSQREFANQFAKLTRTEIVTLPFIGCINSADLSFGDHKLYNVSPKQFLFLIKNAEYVITDSFHAMVFSITFQTKFFAVSRIGGESMGARVSELLKLFDMEYRYLSPGKEIETCRTFKDQEMNSATEEFNILKDRSEHFLQGLLASQ